MIRIHVKAERIETTKPGDAYRTWRPGAKEYSVSIRVPAWLADFMYKCGVKAC